MSSSAVVLINPKIPFNVGTSLRSCSIFGAKHCYWTGDRVAQEIEDMKRLPREERMKDYTGVYFGQRDDLVIIDLFEISGYVPVCVEVTPNSEPLTTFVHPDKAVYVFGPEDGNVPGDIRTLCHRFLRIPTLTRTPLNLAQAVNLVLYDRFVKSGEQEFWAHERVQVYPT